MTIAPARLEDVAPRVVNLARDVHSIAARIIPKYLTNVCDKLIAWGVSGETKDEELTWRMQSIYVLWPRWFKKSHSDMTENVDVLFSLQFEDGEVIFPSATAIGPRPASNRFLKKWIKK
jgi:hypothetical protein